MVMSANARVSDAMSRLAVERERYESLEEELRLSRDTHGALLSTHLKLHEVGRCMLKPVDTCVVSAWCQLL